MSAKEITKLTRADYADQREIRFASYLAASDDVVESYRSVYHPPASWSDIKVKVQANIIARKERVRDLVALERRMMCNNFDFGPREVFQEWLDIATADVNEIISHRRVCCRHCHGIGHAYQWRDADEWASAWTAAMDWNGANPDKPPKELPSDAGGFGYVRIAEPRQTCPKCDGEGHAEIIAHDTRALSQRARKLFAGVKMGKHGPEIILRDQDAALTNIAKALGMFTEKVELSGPGGAPIPVAAVMMPADPQEAAKVYQAIMRAKPL